MAPVTLIDELNTAEKAFSNILGKNTVEFYKNEANALSLSPAVLHQINAIIDEEVARQGFVNSYFRSDGIAGRIRVAVVRASK